MRSCFVFAACSLTLAFASVEGCSSSSSSGASPADAGTPDAPTSDAGTPDAASPADAATCGKLPPTGPTQVVTPSATADEETGNEAKIVLDKKGRPVIAYLDHPASQTQALYVVRWDDCAGSWRAPQKVDDSIDGSVGKASRVFGLAVDSSDGRIAIAYQKIVHLVTPPRQNDTAATFVAISSDDGATFTSQRISHHDCETSTSTEGDINNVSEPNVALAGGKTYVAYVQQYHACAGTSPCSAAVVVSSATGSTFAETLLPDSTDTQFGGHFIGRGFPLGLAVDSSGKVGVVAHREPPTAYDTVVGFWRAGDADVQVVTRSGTVQNDDGAASLVFDGVKPRIVTRLQQGAFGATTDYDLTFSTSDGASSTSAWTTIPLPRPEAIQPTENILFAGGKIVVTAGGPHVFRSTDLATFAVDDLGLAQTSNGVGGTLDASGKLWAVVEGVTPAAASLGGVVFYREP